MRKSNLLLTAWDIRQQTTCGITNIDKGDEHELVTKSYLCELESKCKNLTNGLTLEFNRLDQFPS